MRPERALFEERKEPDTFLRWFNAYTNEKGRREDQELHALCSWAHSVIHNLMNELERNGG
jgi:hypothetical protein